MSIKSTTKLIALVGSLAGSSAFAEPAALNHSRDWDVDVTAYGFIPFSTNGTSTIAGTDVDLDIGLKDAISVLDFAMSARAEAWNGDWGLILDTNYFSISVDPSVTDPAPSGAKVDVDVKQYWLGFLAGYRVANGTYGDQNRRFSVDVQGGARYNYLKQTVKLSGPGPASGTKLGGTEKWWEPVVAVRGIWELSDDWTSFAMADAAGFGVNGDHLQWSTTLGFDYSRWNNGSLKFGVRIYGIDYSTNRSDGKFAYDVTQYGPFFGYTHEF